MFFKKKKKPENEPVLQQDLSGAAHSGHVFSMQLLMEENVGRPDEDTLRSVLQKYLGDSAEVICKEHAVMTAVKQYTVQFKDGTAPPLLMLTDCDAFDGSKLGAFERSQMWDCPDADELLRRCTYQIFASDMLAGAMLDYHERCHMLLRYIEALLELFPQTKAVWFQPSQKLIPVEKLLDKSAPDGIRFIQYAVNVRFFRIQGTEDMLVDSLGMSVMGLPDLQYHFHGADPDAVVNHAYNMLSYLLSSGSIIKDNDTIDGFAEGAISRDVQWKCHHEDALIQPPRPVIDVCMNEFASGRREY